MAGQKITKYIIPIFLFFIINHVFSQEYFETGKVIERVYCLADSSQSYALYLPSNYSKEKQWPIIYTFEPAARGKLPVEKYAELSEQFGYIFVCSYNSKNGPREPEIDAANAMMKDTEERFSIDKRRVYTTGFSGGARVACLIALLKGNIEGVIGCGAGFPGDMPPDKSIKFNYIGFAGKLDMNFQEMVQLDYDLTMLKKNFVMEFFDGGHDWPPVEVYKKMLLTRVDLLEVGPIDNHCV